MKMVNARIISWRTLAAAVILAVATLAAMVVLAFAVAGTAAAQPPLRGVPAPDCINVDNGVTFPFPCERGATAGAFSPEVTVDGRTVNPPPGVRR